MHTSVELTDTSMEGLKRGLNSFMEEVCICISHIGWMEPPCLEAGSRQGEETAFPVWNIYDVEAAGLEGSIQDVGHVILGCARSCISQPRWNHFSATGNRNQDFNLSYLTFPLGTTGPTKYREHSKTTPGGGQSTWHGSPRCSRGSARALITPTNPVGKSFSSSFI